MEEQELLRHLAPAGPTPSKGDALLAFSFCCEEGTLRRGNEPELHGDATHGLVCALGRVHALPTASVDSGRLNAIMLLSHGCMIVFDFDY